MNSLHNGRINFIVGAASGYAIAAAIAFFVGPPPEAWQLAACIGCAVLLWTVALVIGLNPLSRGPTQ